MALILRNSTYWDGESSAPDRADLTCDDGVVVRIDPPAEAGRRTDEDVELDLDGAFVLPGLIDAHVHLVWSGGTDPVARVDREGEHLTVLRAGAHAQAQLHSGITTVRDLGSNWDVAIGVARAVDRGAIQGPTIIASGRTVIMTGGHDPFWGVPADGVDAATSAVRGQVHQGAGVIKTAATGGVYGRPEGEEVDDAELTYDELSAIAAEAHRRGRKVAAHALGTEGVRNAVRAGIDTIEHGVFLTEEIVRDMQLRGTVLCPTAEVYRRIAGAAEGHDAPDYAVRKASAVLEGHRASIRMAVEAGVPIIAGTDAGAPHMAHPTLVDELETLVDYGLSPFQALLACTSRAADALDRPRSGRITVGSPADFVMLDGDPFVDVTTLRQIWGVVRHQELIRARTG